MALNFEEIPEPEDRTRRAGDLPQDVKDYVATANDDRSKWFSLGPFDKRPQANTFAAKLRTYINKGLNLGANVMVLPKDQNAPGPFSVAFQVTEKRKSS